MSITSVLNTWKKDPAVAPNITAWQEIPQRIPEFEDIPTGIDQRIKQVLDGMEISALYSHQKAVWEAVENGQNVVVSTGTASGKSLGYQLPILSRVLKNPLRRSLLLFPTKALAHDQLSWLNEFPDITSSSYDGDTPSSYRPSIRKHAQIVVSNPDMLHIGILPYHIQWAEFFSNLDFVVLDEIHIYRGVFGSHVANVIRRLKRIASHYGSSPQFILTSATIGNPHELGSSLIEEDLVLVDNDTSSRGKKHFLIYNPPIIDPKLGLRASMQNECIKLSSDLITSGNQTILFGRSRRSIEFMLRALKEKDSLSSFPIQSYRSGYLPQDRRHIEADLRSGKIRGITATNALELGIDIGGLDAAILAGYPGTIAGTWQQAGRSGRSDQSSISILVTSSTPIDQYLALHPEYLFSSNPECGLIDGNNLLIALAHLQCAAYELPFSAGNSFGSFTAAETAELLEALTTLGKLHKTNEIYYWMAEDYPAAAISLRNASPQQITLMVDTPDSKTISIGQVDLESAYWMVHPGAVYLHSGEAYLVKDLDLEENCAHLLPTSVDFYTEAEKQTNYVELERILEGPIRGGNKHLGEIQITTKVTGYKKINWQPYEVISRETLDLPATTLRSIGFWITLSENTEKEIRNLGLWSSSPNNYGPDWEKIRNIVLERDQHSCQMCRKRSSQESLHIHHKQPLRSFSSLAEANQLSNLVTLCPRCHQRAEAVVRVNSGIRGLGHVLHGLAPLLLMCDPGDLGLFADFQSPFGDNRPIVLIHEQIPAGIGFSRSLYERFEELLNSAKDLVEKCPCETGCPACVGPGGELGSGGKQETQAILSIICG
jgi:DEAD/DEAH box helicase domain-containing protein